VNGGFEAVNRKPNLQGDCLTLMASKRAREVSAIRSNKVRCRWGSMAAKRDPAQHERSGQTVELQTGKATKTR
jgi:hypothetical protein